MALSAQDKILYVANKLGLSTLGNMQGSTGAVYDVDTDISGVLFSNASRHQNPDVTNLTQNEFEVNEALLIETIGFYAYSGSSKDVFNFQTLYGSDAVIVYDVVIGNKRVMKQTPIFAAGSPYTFANTGQKVVPGLIGNDQALTFVPRHQTYLEGAGILIPPQVQFSIDYRVFNVRTGAVVTPTDNSAIGCYLFGTRVLLNFNTSI
jgi:hypothetical protein